MQNNSASTTGRVEPRRFRPRLNFGFQQDLQTIVKHVNATSDIEKRIQLVSASIDTAEAYRIQLVQLGASEDDQKPTVFYIATLRLLRDLFLQGWTAGCDDEGICVLPPMISEGGEDPSETKDELRNSFKFAVADQLLSPSVSRFISQMERRGIAKVFADGPDLATRLEDAVNTGDIKDVIQPVIELVTPDSKDAMTGIRLQDIWRYARLQWSIPYQQTPGRNIHYLVRDAGLPNRPIIGIAALGNPILGLAQRDDVLGWSVASLSKRLRVASPTEKKKIVRHLVDFLHEEADGIFADDFDLEGLDTASAVERLKEIENTADLARRRDLTLAGDERTPEYSLIREAHDLVASGQADKVDWISVAQTELYRRKRASNLADTLRAIAQLEKAEIRQYPENLESLICSKEGRRAVEIVLRRIKQKVIAENVMEIITCGAVAPYSQILGGKLVAMLMASPQVVNDVKRRYTGRISLIASGMAGRPIKRTPALSLLTTSSLYALGSAQYNRIRIPGDIIQREGEIRYERVGTTDSFGTVQFSSDTRASLVAVAKLANSGQRFVNNLFGEGMSPKLRSLRMGLEALGLPPDEYLRHHSPRLLYAIPLAQNYKDILFGITRRPRYILPLKGESRTTEAIANYWVERWLRGRLERPDTLTTIRGKGRDSHLVSHVASDLGSSIYVGQQDVKQEVIGDLRIMNSTGPISFIERLYRNTNSYADRLTKEELEWLNIDFGINEYFSNSAKDNWQLIVTGNPGDGKTFLIECLRDTLVSKYGAVVITDANACTDKDILSAWRSCDQNSRPFVLAINEWPLFELRRLAREEGFEPVDEAVRQVQNAIYYGDAPDPRRSKVAVVDLSLRNVLAKRIVLLATERITDERFTVGLIDTDPALLNITRIRSQRVQERLAELLSQVSRRGKHVTMRQLMGYLAFVVSGGTDSTTRIMSQGDGRYLYANLAFDGGEGPLFDLLRSTFDPVNITHPDLDDQLWWGTTNPSDWLDPEDIPLAASSCSEEERKSCFQIAKRRFFFEHAAGGDLIGLLSRDEVEFDRVLEEGLNSDPQLVREMVLAVNRFFEPDSTKEDDSKLTLWQSHRYDVRPPTTFVALYNQIADEMEVEGPKLAEWVTAWLPDDLRRVCEFSLTVPNTECNPKRLLIDREVYLTLREAAVGLGRSTWSRSVSRKVTRFVDELHRSFHEPKPFSDLEIRNVDTNLRAKLQVLRNPPRYEL